MDIAGFLLNAASGGILGSALHCVTDYFDTKNKIKLMEATVTAAEKTEAWKAFAASQSGAGELPSLPPTIHPWVANFYICIDGFKQLTRPLLTWASVIIIATVYLNASPTDRAAMSSEIIFGAFTAIFWWFGARYVKNK